MLLEHEQRKNQELIDNRVLTNKQTDELRDQLANADATVKHLRDELEICQQHTQVVCNLHDLVDC